MSTLGYPWVFHLRGDEETKLRIPSKEKKVNNTLYVLCMIQNSLGWKARKRNYDIFKRQMNRPNVKLYTAEIAFGNAQYEVTPPNFIETPDPQYLHLRTDCELWNKEGAINLLIQRLPEDAEYIAWMDADVVFTRPDWAEETVRLLQQYDVIQMFSHTQDLGSSFQPSGPILKSYYYRYVEEGRNADKMHKEWITGLAWASKKSVLSKIGMLPDWCVFSSCDRHIAAGFLGIMGKSFREILTDAYMKKCLLWGDRAYSVIKGNVSYMPGLLLHYWHGDRKKRGYVDRWNVMADHNFDPDVDIVKDWQGLYRFSGNNPKLEEAFKQLLRTRNEDEPGEVLIP